MIDLKKVVIKEKKVDTILTKSNLPIAGYSINPYVGCPFGCEYCYATFMKRFTGHKEDWGMFLDVKMWDKIKNPEKYKGKTMIVGSVTDGYNYFEAKYKRTRAFLEEMQGSGINLIITTKCKTLLFILTFLDFNYILYAYQRAKIIVIFVEKRRVLLMKNLRKIWIQHQQ